MVRLSSVTLVRFTVDIDSARRNGETGIAQNIALSIVDGSAGAESDNMVVVDEVLSTRTIRATGLA